MATAADRAYTALHTAEDKIEPRMARAIRLAAERLKQKLPMAELEDALERGDYRAAGELIERIDFADAYKPSAEIVRESVFRGGKIAAKE
jgi:hypothetical protein